MKGGGSDCYRGRPKPLLRIDVNSGRYHAQQNAEQTAFKTIRRPRWKSRGQLRLRDLGGLIICDLLICKRKAS